MPGNIHLEQQLLAISDFSNHCKISSEDVMARMKSNSRCRQLSQEVMQYIQMEQCSTMAIQKQWCGMGTRLSSVGFQHCYIPLEVEG